MQKGISLHFRLNLKEKGKYFSTVLYCAQYSTFKQEHADGGAGFAFQK
jgi:hypothetical protein